jgi:hypothetical protein
MNSGNQRCLLLLEDDAGLHGLSRGSLDAEVRVPGVTQ